MYADLYNKVLACCRRCPDDARSLVHLAKLYRKANDIVSTPADGMSYEGRCMRTARLENVIADIQDWLLIKPRVDRRSISLLYEKVSKAIALHKSLDRESAAWNDAFVEALHASVAVAEFEGYPDRARLYRAVTPFYESLSKLVAERDALDADTAEWHDVMSLIHEERRKIAFAGRSRRDASGERATLHRDAAMAIRLNQSLRMGSAAWFANAERLHHVTHRLEGDVDSIPTRY